MRQWMDPKDVKKAIFDGVEKTFGPGGYLDKRAKELGITREELEGRIAKELDELAEEIRKKCPLWDPT